VALNLAQKKEVVAEVSAVFSESVSAAVAEYSGMSVADLTRLRTQARETEVFLRVVRNTLAKRSIAGSDFECLNDSLVGPVILALSKNDPGAPARLFKNFSKENQKLVVKALAISGKVYGASDLDAIAKLPTRDEALSKLAYVLKAPITKFVRTLAEPYAQVVRVFAAIGEKKKNS